MPFGCDLSILIFCKCCFLTSFLKFTPLILLSHSNFTKENQFLNRRLLAALQLHQSRHFHSLNFSMPTCVPINQNHTYDDTTSFLLEDELCHPSSTNAFPTVLRETKVSSFKTLLPYEVAELISNLFYYSELPHIVYPVLTICRYQFCSVLSMYSLEEQEPSLSSFEYFPS